MAKPAHQEAAIEKRSFIFGTVLFVRGTTDRSRARNLREYITEPTRKEEDAPTEVKPRR
jgi:hypothetical protein